MNDRKTALILAVLAGLGLLALVATRPDAPGPSVPEGVQGPWFAVQVVKPRSARPFGGLLPDGAFGLPPSALEFDHASSGARVVAAAPDRLELVADGWELLLVIDAGGGIAPGTRLVFPLELAERQRTLRCRPDARAAGHLSVTAREGANVLDGSFVVELPTCEDAGTGKVVAWPPAALTLRGAFKGLPGGLAEGREGQDR